MSSTVSYVDIRLGLRRWIGFGILVWVISGLWGCAGGSVADAPSGDIMTASDEPETRKRARIRLELAVGYFEQGQTAVALDELKQSLSADPNFAEAHNLRGLIYMRLNDARQAEDSFKRALTLSPRDPSVFHNYGWFLCQQGRYSESFQTFNQAIANPTYGGRAKTWLALGLCQVRAGQRSDAEFSLGKALELDAANPATMFNLSQLLFDRGELTRAQFHLKRLNSGDFANAESLWLGIKVEQRLGNRDAIEQLAGQLRRRFPQSRELGAYERRAFNE